MLHRTVPRVLLIVSGAAAIAVAFFAVVFFAATPSRADSSAKVFFDGKTLDGWKVRGGHATYKIDEGVIVGTTAEGSPNTFLSKGPYGDFELQFDVLCDDELNSGVQIRSQVAGENAKQRKGTVYGYQCEIAPGDLKNCGNFWDEARAGKWWDDLSKKPGTATAFKKGEWNHYRIVAQGDRIRSWVNGVACADFRDKTDASGLIGLQVHGIGKGKGPYQVRWKNLALRELKPGQPVNQRVGQAFQALVSLPNPRILDQRAATVGWLRRLPGTACGQAGKPDLRKSGREPMHEAISQAIRLFLREHIGSVVQLELLLILHAEPERAWSVQEIAERFYIPGTFAESLLERLRGSGLAIVSEGEGRRHRFAPASTELHALVAEIARFYRERPVSMIQALYASQADKVQDFADAFRFRKKETE